MTAAKPVPQPAEPPYEVDPTPLTPEQEAELTRREAYIAAGGPCIPHEQVQAMLAARRRTEIG